MPNIGDVIHDDDLGRVQVWDIKRTARGPQYIVAVPDPKQPKEQWQLVGIYLDDNKREQV